jgi:hypothetical protein
LLEHLISFVFHLNDYFIPPLVEYEDSVI